LECDEAWKNFSVDLGLARKGCVSYGDSVTKSLWEWGVGAGRG